MQRSFAPPVEEFRPDINTAMQSSPDTFAQALTNLKLKALADALIASRRAPAEFLPPEKGTDRQPAEWQEKFRIRTKYARRKPSTPEEQTEYDWGFDVKPGKESVVPWGELDAPSKLSAFRSWVDDKRAWETDAMVDPITNPFPWQTAQEYYEGSMGIQSTPTPTPTPVGDDYDTKYKKKR
jgi:hypothetical protein